uniref:Uncharacterized protein n=1 Tax=Musca domestica TaxID=7370 RepID=A0A1I8MFE5_MUSDO
MQNETNERWPLNNVTNTPNSMRQESTSEDTEFDTITIAKDPNCSLEKSENYKPKSLKRKFFNYIEEPEATEIQKKKTSKKETARKKKTSSAKRTRILNPRPERKTVCAVIPIVDLTKSPNKLKNSKLQDNGCALQYLNEKYTKLSKDGVNDVCQNDDIYDYKSNNINEKFCQSYSKFKELRPVEKHPKSVDFRQISNKNLANEKNNMPPETSNMDEIFAKKLRKRKVTPQNIFNEDNKENKPKPNDSPAAAKRHTFGDNISTPLNSPVSIPRTPVSPINMAVSDINVTPTAVSEDIYKNGTFFGINSRAKNDNPQFGDIKPILQIENKETFKFQSVETTANCEALHDCVIYQNRLSDNSSDSETSDTETNVVQQHKRNSEKLQQVPQVSVLPMVHDYKKMSANKSNTDSIVLPSKVTEQRMKQVNFSPDVIISDNLNYTLNNGNNNESRAMTQRTVTSSLLRKSDSYGLNPMFPLEQKSINEGEKCQSNLKSHNNFQKVNEALRYPDLLSHTNISKKSTNNEILEITCYTRYVLRNNVSNLQEISDLVSSGRTLHTTARERPKNSNTNLYDHVDHKNVKSSKHQSSFKTVGKAIVIGQEKMNSINIPERPGPICRSNSATITDVTNKQYQQENRNEISNLNIDIFEIANTSNINEIVSEVGHTNMETVEMLHYYQENKSKCNSKIPNDLEHKDEPNSNVAKKILCKNTKPKNSSDNTSKEDKAQKKPFANNFDNFDHLYEDSSSYGVSTQQQHNKDSDNSLPALNNPFKLEGK